MYDNHRLQDCCFELYQVAVVYVVLGLVIAVVGGTLLEKLGMDRYVEDFIKKMHRISRQKVVP